MEIIPAVIPLNFDDLYSHAETINEATKTLQVDVCDGLLTPHACWPYKGDRGEFADIVSGQEGLPFWETLDYEIDLIVKNPIEDVKKWYESGAKRIVIHIDSNGVKETIEMLKKDYNYEKGSGIFELGLDVNVDTNISILKDFVNDIDFVQCMGILKVGYQNQDFDERVYEKIKEIRNLYPDLPISVDGGVDFENAEELLEAGATRLVVGHAIFQNENPRDAVRNFRDIIRQ